MIRFIFWTTIYFFLSSLSLQALANEPVAPKDSWQPLVSVAWLHDHLNDDQLVILDASVIVEFHDDGSMSNRSGKLQYLAGHIPGSRYADLQGQLSDTEAPFAYTLPEAGFLAHQFHALGIGESSKVIIYDHIGGSWAARVWWMLRWLGFDQAALLDGGINAWKLAGYDLKKGEESWQKPVSPLRINLRPSLFTDQYEVEASIDNDVTHLIDALHAAHFRGEVSMYERAGHIPGAINLPVTQMLNESGQFKDASFIPAQLGFNPDERTIVYCGGGIAASLNAWMLVRAGFTNVAVYDGSLQEWTADTEKPMHVYSEFKHE